ncbi:unnamed protein product, partial [Owenia fusiformis]
MIAIRRLATLLFACFNGVVRMSSRIARRRLRIAHGPTLKTWVIASVGAILGFLLGNVLRMTFPVCETIGANLDTTDLYDTENTDLRPSEKFLFVGVMTTRRYLFSRGIGVYKTWAKSIPGKVVFFHGRVNDSDPDIKEYDNEGIKDLEVVVLDDVDDNVYPPQEKVFKMLEYMHRHYLADYEWFMRSDDDTYVKADALEKFLKSLNSYKVYYLGQPGEGQGEEFGKIGIGDKSNYCMGGPGMIFSRATLYHVGPKLDSCLNLKTYQSNHEDSEVGRCITKLSNGSCLWAYDSRGIFHHNYFEQKGTFKEYFNETNVKIAITLHPIKQPEYLHLVHNFIQGVDTVRISHRIIKYKREIMRFDELTENPGKNKNGFRDKLPHVSASNTEYTFIKPNLDIKFTANDNSFSNNTVSASEVKGLTLTIEEMVQRLNENMFRDKRTFQFYEIRHLYFRINSIYNVDYVIMGNLVHRPHNESKRSEWWRQNVYAQRSFAQLEFMEEQTSSSSKEKLQMHVILNMFTNSSRIFQTFPNFLKQFTNMFLSGKGTAYSGTLDILLHSTDSKQKVEFITNQISGIVERYPRIHVRHWIVSPSTNSLPFQHLFQKESLYFIADDRLQFDEQSLQNIILNTKRGEQAYFPIVSQMFESNENDENEESDDPCFTESTDVYTIYKQDIDLFPNLSVNMLSNRTTMINTLLNHTTLSV